MKASALRIAFSLGLLCGFVWNATASDLPELREPSSGTYFPEEKELQGTCRIHIHETFDKGDNKVAKNVDVSDIKSYSREDCRSEAMLRKLSSEGKANIQQVKVFFSFREPAIVQ